MSRSDSQVFVESLLNKRHGLPQWIPEPHGNLPPAYQEMGDRAGDLLVLREDGVRDYQFNIFAATNDPINLNRVPPGFKPMSAHERDVVLVPEYHKPSTQISNFEVKKISGSGDVSATFPGMSTDIGAGYEFKSTRSSGGALVLPVGASRIDYDNLQCMLEYIEANAKEWFEYVNGVRGRRTRHLYLVTGCDKTSDWGVTSYHTQSRSQEVCLRFTTCTVGVGASYSWSASSSTSAAFRSSQPSLNKVKNQCIFIRGFTITQKTPIILPKSTGGIKIHDLCQSNPWKSPRVILGSASFSSGSSRSPQSSNSSNSPSTSRETPSTCGNLENAPLLDEAQFTDSDYSSDEDNYLMMNRNEFYHPSKVINEYILESAKHVDFAVTHDNDWCLLKMQKPEDICDPNAVLQCMKDTMNFSVFSNVHIAFLKRPTTEEPTRGGGSHCSPSSHYSPYPASPRSISSLGSGSTSSPVRKPGSGDGLNFEGSTSRETDDQPLHHFTAHRLRLGPSNNTKRSSKKVARTKSGCYTCRIRRKKCDERRNKQGQCETCARLRIECLGFGDRRPSWLMDSGTVNAIREKIKGFLGSQGLIRGSFLRHDEPTERNFLWLSDEGHPNAPSDDEGPAASQLDPHSPPLRDPSDLITALEPIDTKGHYEDKWGGASNAPQHGYPLRDATQYSADPMFVLKQEEKVALDNLGLDQDGDSHYLKTSGATDGYSNAPQHGYLRDATHYSVDPTFMPKQEEKVALNNLVDQGGDSPYSFSSGATGG